MHVALQWGDQMTVMKLSSRNSKKSWLEEMVLKRLTKSICLEVDNPGHSPQTKASLVGGGAVHRNEFSI